MNVINIRKAELRKKGYKDLRDWLSADSKHVYIGRNMSHYIPGAIGSMWQNPYSLKHYTREESLKLYKDYVLTSTKIQSNGKTLFQSLMDIKTATLGCFCHPEACHGHVLANLVTDYCNTCITDE